MTNTPTTVKINVAVQYTPRTLGEKIRRRWATIRSTMMAAAPIA